MSSDSTWKTLQKAFTRKASSTSSVTKGPSLQELMSVVKRGKTRGTERLAPSETLMRRSELLYRMEPLIFSGINKITRRIASSKVYFTGPDEKENSAAELFFEQSNMKTLMPHLTKDAFIYGFGVAEMQWTDSPTVTQIDPKEFDYIREGSEPKIDAQGNIVGYSWKKLNAETTLTPDQTFLLRFFTLGEYCLGISPIEPAFKSAWIKLNLEESLGEAIFRHGFPMLKFKIGMPDQGSEWHDITPEKIKAAKAIIGNLDNASELVLPWWMDAEVIKTGEMGNVSDFLSLLSMEILAALEMPKAFGIEVKGVGGRAVEELDFEKTIIAFQEELKHAIEEQFMVPYYKKANFKTYPRINFTEYAPEMQNAKLRRLSAYAKNGLITKTDELENALRRAEGFPLKEKKKLSKCSEDCLFNLGICPIRREEALPLDQLGAFCNICVKRVRAENRAKNKPEPVKEEKPVEPYAAAKTDVPQGQISDIPMETDDPSALNKKKLK